MYEYRYLIKKIERPSTDLAILILAPAQDGPIFSFRPGQYVMLSFYNHQGVLEERHAFSIASAPTSKESLSLGIRIRGRFTRQLLNLAVGAEVFVYGPYGSFGFDEINHKNAVFIAGGIGITPFFSALAYATDKQLTNQFSLIYSNRSVKSTAFFDELKQLEVKNPNIKTLFSVTNEVVNTNTPGVAYKQVDLEILKQFIQTPRGKTFFLCGPAPFMKAMKNCLRQFGAKEEQILMEEFAMISNGSFLGKISYAGSLIGWGTLAMLLPFYFIYAANTKAVSEKMLINNSLKAEKEPQLGLDAVKTGDGNVLNMENIGTTSQVTTTPVVTLPKKIVPTPQTRQASSPKIETSPLPAKTNPAPSKVAPQSETRASNIPTTSRTQTSPSTNSAPIPTTGASGAPVTGPSSGVGGTATNSQSDDEDEEDD